MFENRGSVLTGMGLGMGLMYLLDPNRGRRRRALIRDRMTHASRLTRDAAGATGRDVAHRATGAVARLRGGLRNPDADDRILAERVRSQIGRVVSHPRAIEVNVAGGVIALRGAVLQSEVPQLLAAVRRVRGVGDVVNQLDEYKEAANIPALQGGSTPPGIRPDFWQERWSPATRLAAGSAGATLAAMGASRRDFPGALIAAAGFVLAARAASNLELRRLTGAGSGRRAVDVQKTITIDAPVDRVFEFWSRYENFPKFMSRVLDVRESARREQSHWKVAGPAGIPVEFDARITRMVADQLIAWRTVEGAAVGHAGVVRFEPTGDGRTRVQVQMTYNPPGGWLAHGVAAAFGVDPKTSLDEDLARMKTLLETGRPAHDAAQPQLR
jgi:uncharacterized membrane protein